MLEDGEEAFQFEGVGVFQGATGGAVDVAVVREATALPVVANCTLGGEEAVIYGFVVFGDDVCGEEEELREFWDVKV